MPVVKCTSDAMLGILLVVILSPPATGAGADVSPPQVAGWRGNFTGLFPDADPPTHWGRIARGVLSAATCQASKPADASRKTGEPVRDGLIRQWLVLGPIPVADSVKDFGKQQVPGEADLKPAEGDKVGELAWKRFELKRVPDYERWGTTELDWIDLAEAVGYKPNQVGYAHAYLYCERAGKAAFVVDHGNGLKAWLNGKPLYEERQQAMGLGSYVGISRYKQNLTHGRSPRFECTLDRGWNRLLVKVGSYNARGSRTFKFALRLFNAEPVRYEDKNILWATPLPERTNASPIIVGDRVFTPAEPDELICLDKHTGKVLWRRINGFYEATPEAIRAANPVFQQKIAPLAAALQQTTDYQKGLELRRTVRDLLLGIDKKLYGLKWDDHLAGHFAIVGFTTTPASDGKHVYAFFGHGVVACYDLEGNPKWIKRLEAEEIRYSCSPALIGGKLICTFGGMHGLDAATGNVVWKQPEVTSIAALIPARIRGVDVVATRDGRVFRAADGKPLWSNPAIHAGDTGWAAPVILNEVMYLPWHGVGELIVADFSEVSGDAWKPKVRTVDVGADHRRPNGQWLDRWTAGSPIVHQGVYYNIDQYGVFYAVDLASGKPLYKQDVGFDELHHYNAIGVGASPTLAGRQIYVIDNQGTGVVLEAGRTYKQLAVNRIETLLPRDWPIPPQEILANAAPVFDGNRMYLRGEQHLYCIGK
jgi:outer membrane protein assembly factor BamB